MDSRGNNQLQKNQFLSYQAILNLDLRIMGQKGALNLQKRRIEVYAQREKLLYLLKLKDGEHQNEHMH